MRKSIPDEHATPPPPAEARLDDIYKSYWMSTNEVRALSGITLSFARGSFWAVMGPSGSGKSTLLNLVGCLDRPSSSELRLRELGFIFQDFNLIPQLTVLENIQLPLHYSGWNPGRSAERARELAGQVELSQRLFHRPAELSGGQQQRVAIARALANDPALLLADEPTGNVDTATGKVIMELLAALNRQGRTIIMVTHDVNVASYAKSRLYLKDGAIERIEGDT
jgi:putative ABC transport system ATP-binding protein